jgi:cathepsin H
MKASILLFRICFVVSVTSLDFSFGITFSEFKIIYRKTYLNLIEERIAEAAFITNQALITLTNAIPGLSYKLGLNEYADKTFDSFQKTLLRLRLPSNSSERGNRVEYENSEVQNSNETAYYTQVTTPASVDYRNRSLPIKNQMNCGSCWAFVVLGILGTYLKNAANNY